MLKIEKVILKRYLVCGGRDFKDWQFLQSKMEELLKVDWMFVVVHGDARGADRLAAGWARSISLGVEAHPANWELYGKAAGVLRNQLMLNTGIDGVVAFAGGTGTNDMVNKATRAGVPVWDLRGEK